MTLEEQEKFKQLGQELQALEKKYGLRGIIFIGPLEGRMDAYAYFDHVNQLDFIQAALRIVQLARIPLEKLIQDATLSILKAEEVQFQPSNLNPRSQNDN